MIHCSSVLASLASGVKSRYLASEEHHEAARSPRREEMRERSEPERRRQSSVGAMRAHSRIEFSFVQLTFGSLMTRSTHDRGH
jgi:hypothetical protein